MTFDIREHLERLEPNPREHGKYFCPACGGHNLSINLQTGAYNCWSDNTDEHRALIRENLSPAKLEPTRPEPGRREWKYFAAEGKVAATVVRVDHPFEEKDIKRYQQQELMLSVLPLYWADCIKQYNEDAGRIYLVEGEDVADMMRSIGLNAISFIGGSTGYKKELYHDLLFQIRDALVLCPDMDKPGMKLMDAVAQDFPEAMWCYVQGPNFFYWASDRLPEKGGYDLADAIRNGADAQRVISWISRRQSFALTGQALEADVKVNEMLDGLQEVYTETLDYAVRELKVAQYLKSSGLKDLGWTIQRAMKHCACKQSQQGMIELVDSHDLISMPTKRPNWIIPGFLPAASVILLGASGGTGKTTICYNLAKHIATGQSWSQYPVVQGKVLIISTDESSHDTKEKLQTIDFASVPRGGVSFIRFWRFSQVDLLEEQIRQIEPALVIIDSLTSTTAGIASDRTSSSAGDCLYELRDIAEKYECSFIVLHHLNKQNEFRDSTTYVDNVSEAWKLTRDQRADDFILDYEKSRSGFQGKLVLRRNIENYQWRVIGRVSEGLDWNTEMQVARWINTNLQVDGVENWLTNVQLANRINYPAGEINNALTMLRLSGLISCDRSIIGGQTISRYAAWNAKRFSMEQSKVVPIAAPEADPTNDYDEILLIIRESYSSGNDPEQMCQMLETYPWPVGGQRSFWALLDRDLKAWLTSSTKKQKRA
jgi:archaellum biogenesis ATPase FlaH